MPTLRKALVFGAQALVVLAVLLAVYPWLGPAYRGAVVRLAGAITPTLDPPTRIETLPEGGWHYVVRGADGRLVEIARFDRTGARMATLNVLLLPSLLLATPVGWRRRLGLCALGFAVLLAVQTLTAVLWAKTALCLSRDPEDLLCNWAFYVFVTGGQFYAVAIWGLLTWRVWLPGGRG